MAYGRACGRLLTVTLVDGVETARDIQITTQLHGRFSSAFQNGSNRCLLPTRTMAKIAALQARMHSADPIEICASSISCQMLEECRAADTATTVVEQLSCSPRPGTKHTFDIGSGEVYEAKAVANRDGSPEIHSGFRGFQMLLTTGSSFTGFLRGVSGITTMLEIEDRPLGQVSSYSWSYLRAPDDYDQCRKKAWQAILSTFDDHRSHSTQHTAFLLGASILEACPEIANVKVNLRAYNFENVTECEQPPAMENNADLAYATTTTPYGMVTATIARSRL
ncbi:hypothetical protein ACFWIB_39730 [Streptomyces sp. NPDC127051]|uniref:hypothetical protein n=1 Tax=Streptomyces sp. NPDC127051 TaxID=3347119 RepID=UPI0036671F36